MDPLKWLTYGRDFVKQGYATWLMTVNFLKSGRKAQHDPRRE